METPWYEVTEVLMALGTLLFGKLPHTAEFSDTVLGKDLRSTGCRCIRDRPLFRHLLRELRFLSTVERQGGGEDVGRRGDVFFRMEGRGGHDLT